MKIPPFIATLGMMMLLRGLSLVIPGTRPIYFNDTPNFPHLAESLIGEFCPSCRSRTASSSSSSSRSPRAWSLRARRSAATPSPSVPTRRRSDLRREHGLLGRSSSTPSRARSAASRGLIIASRLNSAQPALGHGYELDAIAAVVIGGTSLSGGRGTILGTIIGALIISVLTNGLRILSVAQEWQTVVTGIIIILAVYADILRRKG